MNRTGVLICGHGSRDPEAVGEFESVVVALRARLPDCAVAGGHLEFARPTIREGLALLTAGGARRILAVPAMLFAGSHVRKDLPREISRFMADNPGVDIRLGPDLSAEALLLAAAADRIAAVAPASRRESLLLVVGRGTGDPDANSSIAEVARRLAAKMGFGSTETAFSGIAQPRVPYALTRAAGLGFAHVVVFPFFLFAGVLVKRIYADTDAAAARFPSIRFDRAGWLGSHPAIIDALCDRAREWDTQQPATKCHHPLPSPPPPAGEGNRAGYPLPRKRGRVRVGVRPHRR